MKTEINEGDLRVMLSMLNVAAATAERDGRFLTAGLHHGCARMVETFLASIEAVRAEDAAEAPADRPADPPGPVPPQTADRPRRGRPPKVTAAVPPGEPPAAPDGVPASVADVPGQGVP